MTQTNLPTSFSTSFAINLAELAKNGDRQAIATLLNRAFAEPNTSIGVDWHGGTLNLRFVSPATPDQQQAIAFVQAHLPTLQIGSLQTVRLFGYQGNQPAPLWNYTLSSAAASTFVAGVSPTLVSSTLALLPCFRRRIRICLRPLLRRTPIASSFADWGIWDNIAF